MKDKILLTIWLDNAYGCINKCKYCHVSHRMIEHEKILNYSPLLHFLNKYYKDIFRIEIMGHELYDEIELLKIVTILNKFHFTKDDIFLTTNAVSFYSRVFDKVKTTISFNGFSSIDKNISTIHSSRVKENLIKYFGAPENIDKINWIIGDFNINTLEEDLSSLYSYLDEKGFNTNKMYIKFLLQKGVSFSRISLEQYVSNINKANPVLRSHFRVFGDMLHSIYPDIGKDPMEVTYCINRRNTLNWYRCPWEIINTTYTLDINSYMLGKTKPCSNICSSIDCDVKRNSDDQYLLYKSLMNKVELLNISI